jgi:hypothetical protein
VRDSYAEICRWSLVDAEIMHEFLDQIDAQAAESAAKVDW